MSKLILFAVWMLSIVTSCSSGDDPDRKPIIPSDLLVDITIGGQTDVTPYGDGSGSVLVSFTAHNATDYKIAIDGQIYQTTDNVQTHTFTEQGLHEHTVIVSAYNMGEFISNTQSITVYVEELTGLLWSDEFNDGSLDLSKWSYETGTGVNGDWGTGQLDRATDRVENVSFQNGIPGADGGCLVITTHHENYIDRNYTSGRINTNNKASWGPGHRIVARVHAKDVRYQGQGFAFWMMPQEKPMGADYIMWPQGGEIDIMEYVGAIPFHNLGTVHFAWEWQNNEYQGWNHGHLGGYFSYETQQTPIPAEPGYGNFPPSPDNQNAGSYGFYEYGIDWYEDRIEFFVDDNVYHIHYLNDGAAYSNDGQDELSVQQINGRRVTVSEYSNHFNEWSPFEHEMFLILSAGVGGSNYTYGGAIVAEAEFPCAVYVDWVRVYAL